MNLIAAPSSRRSFLKAAGLAFTSPLILPRNVLGADAPSRKISVGLIGTGRQMIHANLPAFLSLENCTVTAVCDVDAWRMDTAKNLVEKHYAKERGVGSYKGCAVHRDFRELIARTDIDAVMVATPDHSHVPISIAAMKAGKDVSCEKPLTLSIHEGRVLADTAKKLGRVTRTDTEFRSSKLFNHLIECVRSGRVGNVKRIFTGTPKEGSKMTPQPDGPVPEGLDYEMWQGSAPLRPYNVNRVHPLRETAARPGWIRIRDYSEGMVCNWGTHLNDIAQSAHNSDRTGPVEVEAHGKYPTGELWDVLIDFEAHYRYADGVELHYKMDRPYIRVEGDEGWIEMPYASPKLLASDPKIIAPKSGDNWVSLTRKQDKEDFIDACISRGPTMCDFEVGHRTVSLCQIAHIAIQLGGKKLKWDPAAEKFDDEAANKLLKRPSWRAPWTLDEA